jgi:phosphonopyruvate decarboxylase
VSSLNIDLLDSEVARLLLDKVRSDINAVDMHYASPYYIPYQNIMDKVNKITNQDYLIPALKMYQNPRGSIELRECISKIYWNKFNLKIDPESEIIITNGSVEAFNLAVLSISEKDDLITISNPTYQLFKNAIHSLSRRVGYFERPAGDDEYENIHLIDRHTKALVINSPENPTGYTLSKKDWEQVSRLGCWIIHDEIYSFLDYNRPHVPAINIPDISSKTILVNGFSKCFGLPGLKLGWMIAPSNIIDKAIKFHDYLYLSVNSFNEQIGTIILSDSNILNWLDDKSQELKNRSILVQNSLTSKLGYIWDRPHLGGLSMYPNINQLYNEMPSMYKIKSRTKGACVSEYLFSKYKVSVTPGSIYGSNGNDYIKLAICSNANNFNTGIQRLTGKGDQY